MASHAGYLLDTNIVVALVRDNPLGKFIDGKYNLSGTLHRSAVSIITVGEMHSLATQFGWGNEKRDTLEEILEEIVWIDINHLDVLRAYGEIDTDCQKAGRSMGENDTWIAATAHVSGMTLLTTDKDFDFVHSRFITREWIDPETGSPSG